MSSRSSPTQGSIETAEVKGLFSLILAVRFYSFFFLLKLSPNDYVTGKFLASVSSLRKVGMKNSQTMMSQYKAYTMGYELCIMYIIS
jgi:hypothetical protein